MQWLLEERCVPAFPPCGCATVSTILSETPQAWHAAVCTSSLPTSAGKERKGRLQGPQACISPAAGGFSFLMAWVRGSILLRDLVQMMYVVVLAPAECVAHGEARIVLPSLFPLEYFEAVEVSAVLVIRLWWE